MQNSRSFLALVSSCLILQFTLSFGSGRAAGKTPQRKTLPRRTRPRPIPSRLSPRTPLPRAPSMSAATPSTTRPLPGPSWWRATNDADASLGINPSAVKETPDSPPTARMFYVAYFKKDAAAGIAPGDLYLQRRSRAAPPCGCTWALLVRGASLPPTTSTLIPLLINW